MNSIIKKYFFPLCIFIFASFYVTYPLVFHLGDLITGFGDELLITWIHNWVVHSLVNPLTIFNANIYYPYQNTLAYSDTFFTTSMLGIIPLKLFNQPVAIINFTLISSLIFLSFSIYLLAIHITKNVLPSLLAGLLIMFSPAVLDKAVHLQILAIEFVPLSILFFLLFLESKKTRYLFFCMLGLILQTYNSFLPGYFIILSLVIIGITFFLLHKKDRKKLAVKKNFIIIALSFVLFIPIIIPYYSVSSQFHYVRDIRDTIHLALQPEDFFYTNDYSRVNSFLKTFHPKNNTELKPGFLGIVFSLLVVISLIYFFRNFSKKEWIINSFVIIAGIGCLLSLGPFLHINRHTVHEPFPIPLPYLVFYYLLPGFQGFRNSARWEMLFTIAIAIVIASVLYQLLRNISLTKRFFVYLILFIGIIGEFNFPMKFIQAPKKEQFPKVYSWLQTTPKDSKIIEMPIYTWNMQPYVFNENMREYYATIHFRSMINGASGFSPDPWQEMVTRLLVTFPKEQSIKKIKELQINYIIVHKKEYDALHASQLLIKDKKIDAGLIIINELLKNKSLYLVKKFDDDYVFQIK